MANINSTVGRMSGTIDGITYFQKDGKTFARRKRVTNKSKFHSDPNYIRVRENAQEFKTTSLVAKQIWDSLRVATQYSKDSKSHTRFRSKLNVLKNMDYTSPRGERTPILALSEDLGKTVLKDFDFNAKAPLSSILFAPHKFNELSGQVKIADFNPKIHLAPQVGATHVSFKSFLLDINFDTNASEIISSNEVMIELSSSVSDVILDFTSTTGAGGIKLYILQINFHQKMNDQIYPLNNRAHNTSRIISVL
jgi:hypothetical protein